MPYIRQEFRENYDDLIDQIVDKLSRDRFVNGAGEINYVISRLIWKIFESDKCYNMANSLMGTLGCVQAEFYRERVAPYEDVKQQENGNIKL
jgi:hypothetical protein